MSILIKGAKIPKDKDISLSITVFHDGLAVIFTEQAINPYERRIVERCYKGKAVPVPTPHGRLIDADELLKGKSDHDTISTHEIWNAPTIIESEG